MAVRGRFPFYPFRIVTATTIGVLTALSSIAKGTFYIIYPTYRGMNDSDQFSRRAVVCLAGIAVPTAALAGCLDESRGADGLGQSEASESGDAGAQNGTNSDDGTENRTESDTDGEPHSEGGVDGEPDADGADENGAESDSAETDAASDSDEHSDDADSETQSDDDSSDDAPDVELDPGTDIRFSAQIRHWKGLEPSAIEDTENPTLVLEAGEQYTIGWTEGDGAAHNLAIRNDDEEVVDDLSTEVVTEPGDDQVLEFTASEEMNHYCCEPHNPTMIGALRVE